MVDEIPDDTNEQDDTDTKRIEALEAKFGGVVASVDKLVGIIGNLQQKQPEKVDETDDGIQNTLKGKSTEQQLEALASTVDLLTGAVNKMVTDRQAEQQAIMAAAEAERAVIIEQVVAAMPTYAERKDDLKSVPTSVLKMMLARETNKTPDPKAPVKQTKRLTDEEAMKIGFARKQNRAESLLSMSTFGRR